MPVLVEQELQQSNFTFQCLFTTSSLHIGKGELFITVTQDRCCIYTVLSSTVGVHSSETPFIIYGFVLQR